MDLLTPIEISENIGQFTEEKQTKLTVGKMVPVFRNYFEELWWSSRSDIYDFSHTYTKNEQLTHENQLDTLLDGLIREVKNLPPTALERQAWQMRMRPAISGFALDVLNLKPHHLRFIEKSGLVDAIQNFTQMAREFDPQISAEDIYQAGRNVATANLIQLLLGLPVKVTPSIFAYSKTPNTDMGGWSLVPPEIHQ
jgi:hypothetical protein